MYPGANGTVIHTEREIRHRRVDRYYRDEAGRGGVSPRLRRWRESHLPVLPAGATVGLVTGVSATEAGFPPLQTIAMSIVVYYPTVMLAAFELLESGTPSLIATLTALIVGVFLDAHALAGGLAAATAWRTGSMLATIGVGMGVGWSVQLLVG